MTTRREFADGIAALESVWPNRSLSREQSKARVAAYFDALGDLDGDTWRGAVLITLRTWRPRFYGDFPTPLELRQAVAPDASSAEAGAMFELVMQCREYRPEGSVWSARKIREDLGPAAAEAFAAVGGHGAFAWVDVRDRPFLLKRFAEAYRAAVKANGTPALPGAPGAPQIGRREAIGLLGEIEELRQQTKTGRRDE